MNDSINNGTLKELLEQLELLNKNLSTGNLLGDKNRLFRTQSQKTGWDAINETANENARIQKEKIKQLKKKLEGNLSNEERSIYEKHLKERKKAYLANSVKGAATPEAVFTTAKNITNIIFNVLETNIKKQGIKLQAASELQTRAIQTYGKALNNTIGVQIGNITGTVLDTAYNSLNAVIEGGRAMYMKNLADAITYRRKENEIYKANVEMVTGVAESVGGAMAAFGGTVGLIGNALSVIASVGKRAAMVAAAQTELEIKREEIIKQTQDEWLQQIEGVVKQFADMSKQVTKLFLDAGNSAYTYGRTIGISASSLKQYHDRLIEGVNLELSRFAMNFNDYVKMTASYEGANGGRTGILATRDAMMLGGLSKRLGIGAEEAASIAGSMNVFNTSIADGSDMIYQMSKIANRMGLSATKFAKDLEKNLKLAERYQFRGGVKGMMEMALWAQKMRFNIDEMTSLQEKMLSGNIEDVMQTSARLNVLGGNAALFSDPMSMLFNGINNPAGLAKSLNNMIRGYGRFDEKTGETIFNSVEMLRMNAIAQATGMSRENLMDQARQANKRARISQLYGRKFGEEKTDFLTQHATWSKEKNDWIIKVNAPNEKEGFVEKTLSELSGANDEALNNIFPEDKQDRLIDYVQDIRNFLSPGEQQAAAESYSTAAVMGEASRRGMFEKQIWLANERYRYTDLNKEKYGEMVDMFTKATMKTQEEMNNAINAGSMTKLVGEYLNWSIDQNSKLLEGVSNFVLSNQTIEKYLEDIRNKYIGEEKEKAPKVTPSLLNENYSTTATFRTQVRDAVITPRGTVYTHPEDMIAAFKPNGDIMRGMGNQTNKLEVSGTLRLESNGQSIDLIELVRSNPESLRRLTEEVLTTADRNRYGGRSKHAPNRFTLS